MSRVRLHVHLFKSIWHSFCGHQEQNCGNIWGTVNNWQVSDKCNSIKSTTILWQVKWPFQPRRHPIKITVILPAVMIIKIIPAVHSMPWAIITQLWQKTASYMNIWIGELSIRGWWAVMSVSMLGAAGHNWEGYWDPLKDAGQREESPSARST